MNKTKLSQAMKRNTSLKCEIFERTAKILLHATFVMLVWDVTTFERKHPVENPIKSPDKQMQMKIACIFKEAHLIYRTRTSVWNKQANCQLDH